jgi:hypothetical protein
MARKRGSQEEVQGGLEIAKIALERAGPGQILSFEIFRHGSHRPGGIIPGMIFWKNFRTGHIDTGG